MIVFIYIKFWGKFWYVFLFNISIIKIYGLIVGKIKLFDGVWFVDRYEVYLLKGDILVEIFIVKIWYNVYLNDF